jgi:glycosyltransferase involved in cell wall biosynthesis
MLPVPEHFGAQNAVVFSTWDWGTFNVPERVALSLALRGFRVLYCEMPVSRFRRHGKALQEVHPGIHAFGPEYLGEKFDAIPMLRDWQWQAVAQQIQRQATLLGMKNPPFFYSHVEGIAPLCREMRGHGSRLIHICMDYPEAYQYELIALSDLTLVIPKTVFVKLRARYGEKIRSIPQSIHLPFATQRNEGSTADPTDLANVPKPRLGYLGPLHARVNLSLLREVLSGRPDWQFVCFGDASNLRLANAHGNKWRRPEDLPAYIAALDVGVMPYDCFEEKNLHCVPLKVLDYFLAGLPVVSTPIISLSEFSDLIYFGDTAADFVHAVDAALAEPADSIKRARRIDVARAHSTEALGRRLEHVLEVRASAKRSMS